MVSLYGIFPCVFVLVLVVMGFLPSSGSVAVFAVFSSDTQDSRLFTRQTGIGPFGSMPKLQANAHWRAQRSRQALRHRFS